MKMFRCLAAIGVSTTVIFNEAKLVTAQTVTKPMLNNSSHTQKDPAPSNLSPAPDPLYLPTKLDEVRLEKTQAITLNQALDLARQNHTELRIAELTLKRSQAALRQAQAANSPTIAVVGELESDRSAKETFLDLRKDREVRRSLNSLGSTLEASYDIFTSGKREALVKAAEEKLRIDLLDVQRLSEQIRLDVTNGYYDLQEADEQVRIAQAAVVNAQKSLKDSVFLEEGGTGTQFDILRSKVQLANAEQDLTQAQTQQEISRRQLAQILNVSQSIDVSASDAVQKAGEWSLSLEESIIQAYKQRVELQQQLAQRQISEQQRLAAIADGKPQISLFANYQVLYGLDSGMGIVDGYAVGARLRWNLFDGGGAQAAADQEEVNKAIAETKFTDMRNQIRLQVEKAYKNLHTNAKNIQTAALALKQAQESLDLARLRFQAGVGTQLDVSTAQSELTKADGNRVRAILNYNRALASLQRAIAK
ncbi:TolC family protein [Pseudanabaena sp. PCC 6802]|uniref:TolC family protein n=1 Tax=Pseudanabaena sp. PCC 6802 TaxID=118173 RepID=UPI0012EA6E48|nr:TolC family protein [Pseudanabaena sp. PCC 6802]